MDATNSPVPAPSALGQLLSTLSAKLIGRVAQGPSEQVVQSSAVMFSNMRFAIERLRAIEADRVSPDERVLAELDQWELLLLMVSEPVSDV